MKDIEKLKKCELVDLIESNNRLTCQLVLAIRQVRELINESHGIYGLHLNGDVAEWDSLLIGGCYEEWICEFSIAEEMLEKSFFNFSDNRKEYSLLNSRP